MLHLFANGATAARFDFAQRETLDADGIIAAAFIAAGDDSTTPTDAEVAWVAGYVLTLSVLVGALVEAVSL